MFFIVCASTSTSSVRVGCAGPAEAQAKMLELQETGIGKVRIFDDAGKRITPEELTTLVEAPVKDGMPTAGT